MSPEWVAILALVALFVLGTVLPINMGALAFVAAWLVGMYSLGLDEKEIIAGISGDLILTLVGVTYLFAIARNNGTVDLIVRKAVQSVGGRVALIPWVMFFVTAALTAIGAASPAACAIIGPIALGFAGRYKINPLLMGMLVVHGAQAGGFSPISIYGTITNAVMEENNLPVGEIALFLSSLVVNLLIGVVLFVALGGRGLMSRRISAEEMQETEPTHAESSGVHRDRTTMGTGERPQAGGTVSTAQKAPAQPKVEADQVVTLIVTALFPQQQKGAVSQIAWSTVLLVAGVSTFATVLETAGAPGYVGNWAAGLGAVALGALILCYVGGVVSAFASSTALLPIIIPIAIPLITGGGINAVAMVSALAVSSTIVDVSPFSTNGALMVANRPDTISEERFYKQILTYSAIVVAVGPLLVWAALVLPGWN
jgi:di/tricarboxylate transporter